MRASQSEFHNLRGLRHHLRRWPGKNAPLKLIVHGWSDTGGTWQRLVDHLPADWNIVAPDMRGFGLTERAGDTYIFADYLGDLDAIVRQLGDEPIDLLGHSMGGQVAALYAGLRPERIRRLVILDAMYLSNMPPAKSPTRLREWLEDLPKQLEDRIYPDMEDLARRTAKYHGGLDEAGARQVAEAWGETLADGRVRLLTDPRHRQRGPLLYRDEEARAVFSCIEAPTLMLDAGDSNLRKMCKPEERQARLDCIRNLDHRSIDACGHMMHFDNPTATAAAVRDFLGD